MPPLPGSGESAEVEYERRMMGEGLTYQARQRLRMQCPEYGDYLASGSLAVHRKIQNIMDAGGRQHWETPTKTYIPRRITWYFQLRQDRGISH